MDHDNYGRSEVACGPLQSKAKQSKAKQSKAKQSKAKQSKAKQSKAKQSKAKLSTRERKKKKKKKRTYLRSEFLCKAQANMQNRKAEVEAGEKELEVHGFGKGPVKISEIGSVPDAKAKHSRPRTRNLAVVTPKECKSDLSHGQPPQVRMR